MCPIFLWKISLNVPQRMWALRFVLNTDFHMLPFLHLFIPFNYGVAGQTLYK